MTSQRILYEYDSSTTNTIDSARKQLCKMHIWSNLQPQEWPTTMQPQQNLAFRAGTEPKIRFRPTPNLKSRIKTLGERSVWWILSLVDVTLFI